MSNLAKRSFIIICILFLGLFILPRPSFSADGPIATLTKFSGKVLIKSQGSWGIPPREGLQLYSLDKVVTRIGTATIKFRDGTIVDIYHNTNILVREEEKKKGFAKGAKLVKRHILLFLGKIFFKTGRKKVDMQFETATALVGIRGTAGILSIGADGMTYIKFTEGRAAYTVGEFIEGIAKEVPVEIAEVTSVQRASFVARAAADQLRRTKAKVAQGEMPKQQVALAVAIRDEATAREDLANAEIMMKSPDTKVSVWARKKKAEAMEAISKAKEAQKDAIEKGADPAFKGFGPVEPGFDIPTKPSGLKSNSSVRTEPAFFADLGHSATLRGIG